MSPERIAFYVLWLTPTLVRAVIAAFMLRRKLHCEFPFFFAYTVFHVLKTGVLFIFIHQSPWGYFYAYWISEVFSFGLGFAVIWEVMGHVLRPYEALWNLGRRLFAGAGALLVLVAVATVAGTSTIQDHNALIAWIHVAERGLRLVQCGLLAFLILFSTYFGITWRHHVFGVALGLGVYASVELAAKAVRSEVGWIGDETYNLVRLVASACATLIWAAYLLRPEPARVAVNRLPRTQVEQWNQALEELWQR